MLQIFSHRAPLILLQLRHSCAKGQVVVRSGTQDYLCIDTGITNTVAFILFFTMYWRKLESIVLARWSWGAFLWPHPQISATPSNFGPSTVWPALEVSKMLRWVLKANFRKRVTHDNAHMIIILIAFIFHWHHNVSSLIDDTQVYTDVHTKTCNCPCSCCGVPFPPGCQFC